MKWIKEFLSICIGFLLIAPVLLVLFGATHESGWAFQQPIILWFGGHILPNYESVTQIFAIWRITFNSFFVALLTATISIIITVCAGYGYEKFDFKYKKIIFSLLLSSLLIPQTSILIGQLKVLIQLNIYGTFLGIILPFVINIRIFVYIMNAMKYTSNDLIEAARIDGANEMNILFKIVTPVIKDKILLSFFLLFIASWNNFLIPMITLNSKEHFTLPVMISSLADPLRYDVGATFLALLYAIVPIIILFVVFQKRVFEDLFSDTK